ncbi:Chitin-binding type-1 domain-containing protein [Mycena chlorophos]|uniref:Chitin-binding type-1 domain-containing protein n=1 Tax=Mycena chlorophos TaxID=658473 RepID=A0A8H6W295_MYCCL|nr:Chitin-binding type-1 domain-containing protein [Mycena chlorophos]
MNHPASAFLNTRDARNAFKQTNKCVRGVWDKWYPHYLAANPNTGISAPEFMKLYNDWVKAIISGVQDAVTSTMDTLIPLYNKGLDTGVKVKLSTSPVLSVWANTNPPVPADAPWTPPNNLNTASNANLISIMEVAKSDLETMRGNVPNVDWISELP